MLLEIPLGEIEAIFNKTQRLGAKAAHDMLNEGKSAGALRCKHLLFLNHVKAKRL